MNQATVGEAYSSRGHLEVGQSRVHMRNRLLLRDWGKREKRWTMTMRRKAKAISCKTLLVMPREGTC